MESLTPRPELENTRKSQGGDRTGRLGGFALSNPEKPPLEHGLTARRGGRRAIFIAE